MRGFFLILVGSIKYCSFVFTENYHENFQMETILMVTEFGSHKFLRFDP